MKKYFFLLLLLFFTGLLKSQTACNCNYIENYYQLIYKGQLHYLKENFDSAYIYLKQAEKNCPLLNNPQTDEIGILAEVAVRKKLYDEAKKYVELKLKNGYKIEFYENDSIYTDFRKHPLWEELKSKSDTIYNNWYSKLNLNLRKELIQMNVEDQRVRRAPVDFDEMNRVDSININRLKEIFREYGYPNQNLIGSWHIDKEHADIYTMVFHIPKEETEYFKPIFLEFVKCGKVEYPGIYANLIDSNDRVRGIFTYGIYNNVDADKIEDFENLDKRRTSVGLPPWRMHKEIQSLINKKYNLSD